MNHKESLEIAESLRRQARKSVSKFQTELDLKGGLVDAMRNYGESALYGRIMLELLEPIFNALEREDVKQAEKDIERYLAERNEFLTGMKPFFGINLLELTEAIRNHKPKAPTRIIDNFPADLQDVLAGMLRKEPKNRYQTMGEVVRDLDRYLTGSKVQPAKQSALAAFLLKKDWS